MKKKTVVLCELCPHDSLAVNVLHIGVCGDHEAKVAAIAETPLVLNGSANGNGGRKRRANLTEADKRKLRQLRKTMPLKAVAEAFNVSPSTVTRYAPTK